MTRKVAVIGAGISGLSVAQCLKDKYEITVFEKESTPGGLVRCDKVDNFLYHKVGGHVFNSLRLDVLAWFWNFFNREFEFDKAMRHSAILLDNDRWVGYPIEDHIYMLDDRCVKKIILDFIRILNAKHSTSGNLDLFFRQKFGDTLYNIYFKPYNEKVWGGGVEKIPLPWLEGKLPMPNIEEIIFNNFKRTKEVGMAHSSFLYPKNGGSQFIANRLSKDLTIEYDCSVSLIERKMDSWYVNGIRYDIVVFSGNIKDLSSLLIGCDISKYKRFIDGFASHGTTSVLCEIDDNPYSWIYLPAHQYLSHRIICTGNFASSNNVEGKNSGVVEFTNFLHKDVILSELKKMPLSPRYLTHQYTEYTYPIQNKKTRQTIADLKKRLERENFFLLGRFAEWEYYNMDTAMGGAIDLSKRILTKLE